MQDLLELYEKSGTVLRLADLHDAVGPILDELAMALGYERAFVALVDPATGAVQGAVGFNPPDDSVETLSAGTAEPGAIAGALRRGRTLRVDDVLRDPRVPESERAFFAQLGMLAFAVVPLPPASGVLVVSKGAPLTEADLNELLPYAGRLIATVADRVEAMRVRASGERHAIEREWLWWMLTAVQDPVVLSDEHHNILLHNVHAERLLVAQPEDSEGKRHAIRLNNSLLSLAISSFSLDQGAALERELTLVDPIEGSELLFELICRPATNLRTGERGVVAVLKDVTDLRRADQELRHSLAELHRAGEQARRERDRLNLILANVADPIVVTDGAGETILMNQHAERLFRGPATICRANDAKLSFFLSQLLLEAAPARRGEIHLLDPETEEPLTMSVTATEVRDELGQVTAVVSVLHDLTQIRELERRTVEQQLAESEKLAAVGRLAAEVAHEINNPLEAIKNALYLLVTRTAADDPNRKFLEIARKETERVSDIIRQMLGFYRSTPARAPTDVNRVVAEAVALLERQLRRHKISVHQELHPHLPPVLASADQLKQVFLNLFLNAQEAMPDGGRLHVTTRPADETDGEFLLTGPSVLVQVQDTGTGIPEEHLSHIFEPFFSTKREGRGTGLGLWVSMGIIQQHGGQMKVRSRPGRGTTFSFALPVGGPHG
jgi:signal transduction histidine kinase